MQIKFGMHIGFDMHDNVCRLPSAVCRLPPPAARCPLPATAKNAKNAKNTKNRQATSGQVPAAAVSAARVLR
ncbi:hypothetical protein DYQ94_17585 [Xanthomonas sp. LMG 8993]|uniref:hypothetical protein n=1 Tax=Xanthomonas TaxID=338 RepID=UPI0013689980|nr:MULTISPECIES: hypothetical protein [Xanthomonas]MBB4770528.1 hypothetical protein [Xanthomonas arboricola]MXV48677.1 hypothetical protein [Xanthomonas sp. LMG 8993]